MGLLDRLKAEGQGAIALAQRHPHLDGVKQRLREEWATKGFLGLEALKELWREKGKRVAEVCALPWQGLLENCGNDAALKLVRDTQGLAFEIRNAITEKISRSETIPERIEALLYRKDSDLISKDMSAPGNADYWRREIERLEHYLTLMETRKKGTAGMHSTEWVPTGRGGHRPGNPSMAITE